MPTTWFSDDIERPVVRLTASGFPEARHQAEADLFCRQAAMPGHRQDLLEQAHVVVVGCGGLGSWIALALARMGVRRLTLVDHDRFDRTNVPRQLVMAADIGLPKSHALARNVVPHMTNAGEVCAIALPFEHATAFVDISVNAAVVAVDNNAARLKAAELARARRIPAVFAMLSGDGLRAQVFRQGPSGPCLSCVLPNLDPATAAPCAAASIASCFMAASHAVMMLASALMGEPQIPSWRESSLDGTTERIGWSVTRPGCERCYR